MRVALAGLSGLLAGAAALGVAELVSGAVRPQAGPVTAVGGAVIDRTPPALKDYAVRHFGTNDKLVLQLGIVVVLALFAIALGVTALRFPRTGCAGVPAFGVIGVAAAWSRPDRHDLDVLPSIVGALAGTAAFWVLITRLAPRSARSIPHEEASPEADETPDPPEPEPHKEEVGIPTARAPRDGGTRTSFDRRGFVLAAAATAAASAGTGVVGRVLNDRSGAAARASRAAVVLPRPASPAPPVPAGADLHVPGAHPFLTPAGDFYRVDTALVVPRVDATAWRLRLHGLGVPSDVTYTYDDLLRRDLIERDITLTCVSNEVGGPYVGNARWIGVRLADLLREAGVRPPSRGGPADQIVARSVDGMTIGTPVETVMDGRDAMLALGMNGQPLPFAHGFPVRVVVPGLYGYVSACKWLRDLQLTTFDAYDAYWVRRTWSARAPIKTESRIDTPKPFATPKAGPVPVAGVAWAQHRGIARVQVRVDGGPWHTARLAAEDSADTWRQWMWQWDATPGSHTLEVRATDRTGHTQTRHRVGTVPDGATGWHSVVVDVT
ncbi:molybdopterin-dependent oxidoreductase [Streptomyces sp. HPF1205]|uniref:molybdopterin-dependent oxidoreductase n=1 Tax=Streptomyces sp. HPF1205 TaxID=2873262 RepID=UPI001CEDD240|nr:molybdopterin-dependent oxidoreductase [Streptomyces sp. HPF1205]